MRQTNPEADGSAMDALLDNTPDSPIGPGAPNESARARLEALTIESAFAGQEILDPDMARACLAGLWLRHNFLDRSHTVSQSIETPTGSFWHGIMHRREGDFSNAKYWFRRVGRHPVFPDLGKEAAAIVAAAPDACPRLAALASASEWDPFAFVDLCEEAARSAGTPMERVCAAIQRAEWDLLFEYGRRAAVGG